MLYDVGICKRYVLTRPAEVVMFKALLEACPPRVSPLTKVEPHPLLDVADTAVEYVSEVRKSNESVCLPNIVK